MSEDNKRAELAEKVPLETTKDDEEEDPALKRFKWIKLFWIFMSQVAFAVNGTIDTPTIPDLRERLDLSMEEFSFSKVAEAVGAVIGALLSGLICDRWPRFTNICMAACLAVMGVTLILLPWSPSLTVLCVIYCIGGVTQGVLKTVQMSLFFNLFGAAIFPNYLYHMGWTVTTPFVPLIVEPFLSDTPPRITNDNGTFSGTNVTSYTGRPSRIEIPYGMGGAFILLIAPAFCYYQFTKPPPSYQHQHKSKKSWREVFSLASCSEKSSCFNLTIIMHVVIYFMLLQSCGEAKYSLGFSYAVDPAGPLQMSKTTAAYLTTASAVSYLISRITTILLSRFVKALKIQVILPVSITGLLVCYSVLTFAGLQDKTWFWISFVASDLFQQPVWPGGYIWTENYITVYSLVLALTNIGKWLTKMLIAWVCGRLFDKNPAYPFYVCYGITCGFLVNFIIMQTIAHLHTRWMRKKRISKAKKFHDIDIKTAQELL